MDFHRHGIHRSHNLASVNKGFNKPGEYAAVLERLAQRNVFAITSFIFGMDNDTVGSRGAHASARFAPGLRGCRSSVCSRPCRERRSTPGSRDAGRLTRPKHWLEFKAFAMAHTPLKMTIPKLMPRFWTAGSALIARRRSRMRWNHLITSRSGIALIFLFHDSVFEGFISRRWGPWAWIKYRPEPKNDFQPGERGIPRQG